LRLRTILCTLVAGLVLVPSGGSASRMWLGFQDDSNYRWASDRAQEIARSSQAGATILRTTIYWDQTAITKPANPRDSFDPAYNFDDVDDFVRTTQANDLEVLLTIWGTPRWANGGQGRNVAPTKASDLADFAYAVASRYSGRNPGYPYVRFYSIWNEPNLQQFLKPQFRNGRSVSPHTYALLARAGYAAIKSANPDALVAIGETSPRGHDHPTKKVQDSHSPGRFAELLSKQRPRLRFDAWAHHPYVPYHEAPLVKMRWPNVPLSNMNRFESSLDTWFGRKNIPVWVTEYGFQTRPPNPQGETFAKQAAYLKQAVNYLRKDPRVSMFIWFVFQDGSTSTWKSGLVKANGTAKPALATFSSLAPSLNAQNEILTVKGNVPSPLIRFYARPIANHSNPGDVIGLTYRVYEGSRFIYVSQTATQLAVDATASFRANFTPKKGHTYVVRFTAEDIHGDTVSPVITLVAR
jgi:hypothetical protein